MIVEESCLSVQQSSLSIQQSSFTVEDSSLSAEESSFTVEDSSLSAEHSTMSVDESSLTPKESSLSGKESTMSPEHSTMTLEESTVIFATPIKAMLCAKSGHFARNSSAIAYNTHANGCADCIPSCGRLDIDARRSVKSLFRSNALFHSGGYLNASRRYRRSAKRRQVHAL